MGVLPGPTDEEIGVVREAAMTDPVLAALTEALRQAMSPGHKVYVDPADPDRWYADFAAAILAHPAMADLARKAAIGEAVERLPSGYRIGHDAEEWTVEWDLWDGEAQHIAYGTTLPDAIAAALEQGDE